MITEPDAALVALGVELAAAIGAFAGGCAAILALALRRTYRGRL